MERSFAGAILAQKSGGADSDQHQVLIFPTQPALGYNVSGWAFAIFFFKGSGAVEFSLLLFDLLPHALTDLRKICV